MSTPANVGSQRVRFWDDLVIITFAILGFAGPVILNLTTNAGLPIINSILLATGVSAVVYRYLGGIQSAAFHFGNFRVAGTLAALLGTTFFVNYYLQSQSLSFISAEGRYDWQFAAGGWKGYIDIKEDGTVLVNMNRYMTCAGKSQLLPLLHQVGDGKAKEFANYTKLRVSIPVQFVEYKSDCSLDRYNDTTTLTGVLDRRAAFTGEVEYRSMYGAPLGGMFLVKGD